MAYDSDRYGVITREWFGLTDKWGGRFTTAYTKGSATCVTKLAYWYPRGPITVKKIGIKVLATLGTPATAPSDGFYYRVRKSSSGLIGAAYATNIGTDIIYAHTALRTVLGGIASKEVDVDVAAGKFITVKTSTPYTAKGTVEAGTINGSFAFFIDWIPLYSSKHEIR